MTKLSSDNIAYIGDRAYSDLKRALVYWQPNKYCNYECSYCWPSSHTKIKDFDDAQKSYKTIDDLCNQFYDRGIDKINWGWSGGEPTFHPNFLDMQERILRRQDDFRMTFNITSNISQSIKWWEKFVEKTSGYKVRAIAASLHQEYVHTDKQIKRFHETADFIRSAGITITINQVMDIDLFEDQLELLNMFIEDGFNVNSKINTIENQMYHKYGDGKTGYTQEQLDYMINSNKRYHDIGRCLVKTFDGEEHWFDTTERLKPLQLYHDLNDWMCTAGYISAVIKQGKIRRGVGGCRHDVIGKLGDDFKLFDEPKKCTAKESQSCSCVADLKLPKWRAKDSNIIAKE